MMHIRLDVQGRIHALGQRLVDRTRRIGLKDLTVADQHQQRRQTREVTEYRRHPRPPTEVRTEMICSDESAHAGS